MFEVLSITDVKICLDRISYVLTSWWLGPSNDHEVIIILVKTQALSNTIIKDEITRAEEEVR